MTGMKIAGLEWQKKAIDTTLDFALAGLEPPQISITRQNYVHIASGVFFVEKFCPMPSPKCPGAQNY